ncbi:MAG: segregation and condensation protein A [Sphingomonadaceae bacterium]
MPDEQLTLDLGSWEGPLDLLLALARAQKVDLLAISILALVDQYLDYLERAGAARLEQSADYLVMAAWLAYLKSCLLLPRAEQEAPSPEELADRLQQRLRRLDAMREAGARLMARDRIDRDVFLRGCPEGLRTERAVTWQAALYDVLSAYGRVRARTTPVLHQVSRRPVVSIEAALQRIEAMLGRLGDWTAIAALLPLERIEGYGRSALASTLVATLELARRGTIELRQDAPFGPLLVRAA